jgi:hypothetical protein
MNPPRTLDSLPSATATGAFGLLHGDEYDARLEGNVHPPDWTNPLPRHLEDGGLAMGATPVSGPGLAAEASLIASAGAKTRRAAAGRAPQLVRAVG